VINYRHLLHVTDSKRAGRRTFAVAGPSIVGHGWGSSADRVGSRVSPNFTRAFVLKMWISAGSSVGELLWKCDLVICRQSRVPEVVKSGMRLWLIINVCITWGLTVVMCDILLKLHFDDHVCGFIFIWFCNHGLPKSHIDH